MSRYLYTGHYESFLPINLENKIYYMRVWIETDELVKALKKLDLIFGTPEEPYCRDLYQVPIAMKRLSDLIIDLILKNPERLKRACVERAVADTLSMQYGVKKMESLPQYPETLDQVELDISTLFPILNTLFVKSSIN